MSFKIGDRVEIVNNGRMAANHLPYVGKKATVMSALIPASSSRSGYAVHDIKVDGEHSGHDAIPEVLRKLDEGYDGNEVVRWADCPWQPNKETA